MKLETFNLMYELFLQNSSNNEIIDSAQLSPGYGSRILSLFEYGTRDELEEYIVHKSFAIRTAQEIIDIVKEAIANNYTIAYAAFKYRIEFNQMARLYKKHKQTGLITIDDIVKLRIRFATSFSQEDLELDGYKIKTTNDKSATHFVACNMTEEELVCCDIKKRIFGKATKVPRKYLPLKLMRRRDVIEAKKDQANIDACLNGTVGDVVSSKKHGKTNKSTFRPYIFKGYPASKYFKNGQPPKTIRGRPPFVDPDSEGFNKLPEHVRELSLKRRKLSHDLNLAILKELNKLEGKPSDIERYMICQKLNQDSRFIGLAKTVIFEALRLSVGCIARLEAKIEKIKQDDALLEPIFKEIYAKFNGKVGRISMALELRKYGVYICDQTARKLMKRFNLSYIRKTSVRYSSYKGDNCPSPELLKREFKAELPMQKIVTDITVIPCANKESLYLSVYKDLCTNEIISATCSKSPDVDMVMYGLNSVLEKVVPGRKCIIHSDRGCQYQHKLFRDAIANNKDAVQSMSRKGNCYDNGACESFFGIMKSNVNFNRSDTYQTNHKKVMDFINFYNKFRPQSRLDGYSPIHYRMVNFN